MQLTNEGILKGEDISSFFFRVCTETSVEQWTKYTAAGDYSSAYQPIDALSRLIVLMIKYNGDATDLPAKVHYLTKILSIVVLVLAQAHEASIEFPQQKPFFRFFSSLLNDVSGLEAHFPLFPLLVAIWYVPIHKYELGAQALPLATPSILSSPSTSRALPFLG